MSSISTKDYQKMSLEEVFEKLGSSPQGLSSQEAEKRLKEYGFNEIPEKKENPLLEYLKRYWGPLPWLMEFTIAVSYLAGRYFEAAIMLGLLVLNATLGHYHARSSKKAVELLKRKLTVNARVLREGKWVSLPARELVPGDIVFLRLGSVVPADVKLIEGKLLVDQSALTGESLPVEVSPGDVAFSGSIVKRGEAKCIVVNTGTRTYFGKTLELIKQAKSRSEQEEVVLQVTRYAVFIGLAGLVVASIISIWERRPLIDLTNMAVVFLMSSVPVALPAVLTIMQAYGALELARNGVLVTRLSAAEDFSAVDVSCLDKTGTITMNKLRVVEVRTFMEDEGKAALYALLASRAEAEDPLNLAVIEYAKSKGVDASRYTVVEFTPFDPSIKRSEAVVQHDGERFKVVMGEPRTVLSLSSNREKIEKEVLEELDKAASRGMRTLAVARSKEDISKLELVALIHLLDPPRPDSRQLILELKANGIRPIMLTGDNVAVAKEIAKQVGIGERVLSVRDLRSSGKELVDVIDEVDGLAEVYPEDKFHVVKALQAKGHFVAMTGDGVNDAPALSQAEVGIAVENATDAAKAAASIVLVKPGIEPIVMAVKVSRTLHERALSWVINKVSKTVQSIAVLLAGMLVYRRMLLEPVDMALLLLANDFLTMSLATDHATPSQKPTRWRLVPIAIQSLLLGFLMALPVFLVSRFTFSNGADWSLVRATTLLAMVYTSQFRVLMVRERDWMWHSKPGRELTISIIATFLAFTLMGLYGVILPRMSIEDILTVLACSLTVLLLEPLKVFLSRKNGLKR
ncbi:MAG: plasma-membrane proton-efflux P-type ATPase [Infirmifilum sp.]|uniref:plasma-membrane proton-efflux P-type ATPase n=1 Tax=Infirmifilum TaxID=2856573 RepID=UPI003C73CA73